MLQRLGLRTRIFLIFAGLAAGAQVALVIGLWLGFRRLGHAGDAGCVRAGRRAGRTGGARPDRLGLVPVRRQRGPADRHAWPGLSAPAPMPMPAARWTPPSPAIWATSPLRRRPPPHRCARPATRLRNPWRARRCALVRKRPGSRSLLSDVPVGVLLCTAAHQIVFYNAPAADYARRGRRSRP